MNRICLLIALWATISASWALEIPPMIRAGGSVFLKVRPGTTRITVRKRDLNIYENEDTLRLTVTDPLRRVVARVTMPDDGAAPKTGRSAKIQEHTFSLPFKTGGIMEIKVATNGDQVWGLEANAVGVVVQSTMMLNNPDFAAKVYFPPKTGEHLIEVQAIHPPGFQEMPLLDAAGKTLKTFPLVKSAEYIEFPVADGVGDRTGLWHFDVSKADVLMRFKKPPPLWTLNPDWWFEMPDPAWTLLPKHVVRYVMPGEKATVRLRQYAPKGGSRDTTFRAIAPSKGGVALTEISKITPAPVPGTRAAKVVEVTLGLPPGAKEGESYSSWLCATSPTGDIRGSGRLELRVGKSPVDQPLKLPIRYQLHAHENVQFGYNPDYPTNEVYFSPDNRALIRNRWVNRNWTSSVMVRNRGRWIERPFTAALDKAFPEGYGINRGAGFINCKVVADGKGGLYTALSTRHPDKVGRVSLLYSFDYGTNWQVVAVPGSVYDIENFSGHNFLTGPTPFLVYKHRAKHPTARYGAYYDLSLYLPKRVGDRLEMGAPIHITDDCLGSCQHSGGPPALATKDGRTHVIWGQAIETEAPGVPSFITTVDHATRKVSPHAFLGHAPPINDVHNVPAACFDSEGTIHIITGAHGDNFTYRRSLKPNDTQSGFTKPVNTLNAGYVDKTSDADGRGRQTYCSLVCDDEDTLHIAYRQWRQGVDRDHGGANYAALSIQSKPKGKPWGPARPMVVPPVAGYSIYYHKLTIAPHGGLYLSYSYYTADEGYQSQFPELYNNRAVIVSKDRGKTWKLAESKDFPGGEK